jgi:hypothetical protein
MERPQASQLAAFAFPGVQDEDQKNVANRSQISAWSAITRDRGVSAEAAVFASQAAEASNAPVTSSTQRCLLSATLRNGTAKFAVESNWSGPRLRPAPFVVLPSGMTAAGPWCRRGPALSRSPEGSLITTRPRYPRTATLYRHSLPWHRPRSAIHPCRTLQRVLTPF